MRRIPTSLGAAITGAGHALIWSIVGVAILLGRVVGVPQSPANVAVGIGAIVSGVLVALDEFGLLPEPGRKLVWPFFFVVVGIFLAVNFL